MEKFSEKINLKEKFSYFKKLFWLFILILIIGNIIFFYFLNGIYYFLALIVGNIVLFWILVPIFMWIGKTYLIDSAIDIVNDTKNEIDNKYKDDIIQVVGKK